ncbi:MAG: hypothetical protein NTX33_19895 [Propionibacteriales bacterium]|nr:hypothetical protein [Propionibacteriales bacterium]
MEFFNTGGGCMVLHAALSDGTSIVITDSEDTLARSDWDTDDHMSGVYVQHVSGFVSADEETTEVAVILATGDVRECDPETDEPMAVDFAAIQAQVIAAVAQYLADNGLSR